MNDCGIPKAVSGCTFSTIYALPESNPDTASLKVCGESGTNNCRYAVAQASDVTDQIVLDNKCKIYGEIPLEKQEIPLEELPQADPYCQAQLIQVSENGHRIRAQCPTALFRICRLAFAREIGSGEPEFLPDNPCPLAQSAWRRFYEL